VHKGKRAVLEGLVRNCEKRSQTFTGIFTDSLVYIYPPVHIWHHVKKVVCYIDVSWCFTVKM